MLGKTSQVTYIHVHVLYECDALQNITHQSMPHVGKSRNDKTGYLKPKFSFGKFYYFESSMPTDHTTPITGSKCLSFFFMN